MRFFFGLLVLPAIVWFVALQPVAAADGLQAPCKVDRLRWSAAEHDVELNRFAVVSYLYCRFDRHPNQQSSARLNRCRIESSILIPAGDVPALIEESSMTELRNRMDEAMVLRGFSPRTRETYLACVQALAKRYRKPPDVLDGPKLQAYLLLARLRRLFGRGR